MTAHRLQTHAINIKQVATCVVANTWAQNDTVTLTINGLDFVITIGTLVTTAQVATTIKQAFNGETLTDTSALVTVPIADGGAQKIPEFSEILASVSSSTVTFTARTAGKPFTMSAAATTAGTGDVTYSNAVTANTGKHNLDNADNLSGGAALADDDTLTIDEGNVDVKYGLTLAAQLASITKTKNFNGTVGLPETNVDNAAKTYSEYRTPKYLTTDDNSVTTTANLETGSGQGSGRFKWDAGAGQVVLNLHGRGQRKENGVPCVLFKGSHASNEVNNLAGDLGIAFFGGETAVVPTLRNGPSPNAETVCGSGVTLTTVTTAGGKVATDSAITTVNQTGGEHSHGSGTVTTANVDGGTFFPLKDATITTLRVGSNGVFDCRRGNDSFAITNTIQLYKGAKFLDPAGRTGNPVFKLNRCGPQDVTIELPPDKTYTLS